MQNCSAQLAPLGTAGCGGDVPGRCRVTRCARTAGELRYRLITARFSPTKRSQHKLQKVWRHLVRQGRRLQEAREERCAYHYKEGSQSEPYSRSTRMQYTSLQYSLLIWQGDASGTSTPVPAPPPKLPPCACCRRMEPKSTMARCKTCTFSAHAGESSPPILVLVSVVLIQKDATVSLRKIWVQTGNASCA